MPLPPPPPPFRRPAPPPVRRALPPPPQRAPQGPPVRLEPIAKPAIEVKRGPPTLGFTIGRTAKSHDRRVTLNLIRLSFVCPAPLRDTLEVLASHDWDFSKLTRLEYEHIFGHVNESIGLAAAAEFEADPSMIQDHRACDATCKLCGQQHIRFEFLLRNKAGGRDVWTGSDCIIQYGLAVDGSGTQEEALKRLQEAIRGAIHKAYREDWQAANPDHARIMDDCKRLTLLSLTSVPREMYDLLKYAFRQRAYKVAKRIKAALKYYDKHQCLTEKRTPTWIAAISDVRDLLTEYDTASTALFHIRALWTLFLERTDLTLSERNIVKANHTYAKKPQNMLGWEREGLKRLASLDPTLHTIVYAGVTPPAAV